MNDQIRSRWVGGVRGFAATLSHQDIQRLSKVQRQTEIEVVLQPDGYLKTVLVNRSSGEPGLDEAAVVAFKKAAPLLNPPTEMKGDDGMIHLHYSFVIQWQPNYLVRKAE